MLNELEHYYRSFDPKQQANANTAIAPTEELPKLENISNALYSHRPLPLCAAEDQSQAGGGLARVGRISREA